MYLQPFLIIISFLFNYWFNILNLTLIIFINLLTGNLIGRLNRNLFGFYRFIKWFLRNDRLVIPINIRRNLFHFSWNSQTISIGLNEKCIHCFASFKIFKNDFGSSREIYAGKLISE